MAVLHFVDRALELFFDYSEAAAYPQYVSPISPAADGYGVPV